jgi:hypothetical protein
MNLISQHSYYAGRCDRSVAALLRRGAADALGCRDLIEVEINATAFREKKIL